MFHVDNMTQQTFACSTHAEKEVNVDAINSSRNIQQSKTPVVSSVSVSQSSHTPESNHQPVSASSSLGNITNSNKQSLDVLLNNSKEVTEALAELSKLADNSGRSLGFAQDNSVSGPVITVTDKESGKVVRQIPVEAVVRVAHSIEKMKGLLFDKVL